MSKNSRRYRKPDLMFLIACFVGFGVLLTSVAQAEQAPLSASVMTDPAPQRSLPEKWFYSLDLANRLKNWKPKIEVVTCDEGLNLSRPFGIRGPVLQISTSVPEYAEHSLRAGGDSQVGTLIGDQPDAYLFLQQRW
ncbi:MAG: hypothetical protein J5I92_11775 [Thiogranum sp.]|nr:hypothetical protein [Thiogranum sp.]